MTEINKQPKPNSWSEAVVLFFVIVILGSIFASINSELDSKVTQEYEESEVLPDNIPSSQNIRVLINKIHALEESLPRMRSGLLRMRKMDSPEFDIQEAAMKKEIEFQEKNLREMREIFYQYQKQQGAL